MEWLYRGNTKRPLTRQPLHPDDFILDKRLQIQIARWKQDHETLNSSLCDDSEEEDEEEDNDGDGDDFDDILEIASRLTTNVVARRGQQRSPATNSADVTTANSNSNRLTDIRARVLQQREEKIHRILNKMESEDGLEVNSLAALVMAPTR